MINHFQRKNIILNKVYSSNKRENLIYIIVELRDLFSPFTRNYYFFQRKIGFSIIHENQLYAIKRESKNLLYIQSIISSNKEQIIVY